MGKLFSLITLLTVSICANAQFALTPNNFISTNDESKSYIVLEFGDVSKQELYNRAKKYLNTVYNNPDLVISSVENEQITIDAYTEIVLPFALGIKSTEDFYYKYTIDFKDGRIRFYPLYKHILITESDIYEVPLFGYKSMGQILGIYNKKKKCIAPNWIEPINDCVNNFVESLDQALNGNDASTDDW